LEERGANLKSVKMMKKGHKNSVFRRQGGVGCKKFDGV
jgi:hypothetical protein